MAGETVLKLGGARATTFEEYLRNSGMSSRRSRHQPQGTRGEPTQVPANDAPAARAAVGVITL